MATQEGRKKGAIGLGALSALLGFTAKTMHKIAPKQRNLATQQVAKIIRNASGAGALGAGVGSAILATKYYKNKKPKVTPRAPTDAEMRVLLKGQPDAKGYKGG